VAGQSFDDGVLRAHLTEATRCFPGPAYTVLGWIYEILRPETYVQIGI